MQKRLFALTLVLVMLVGLTACSSEKHAVEGKPVIEMPIETHPEETAKPVDPNKIEFTPHLALVDNGDIKIEVTSIHQEIHNWTDRGECLDKHLNIKITHKDTYSFYPNRSVNISTSEYSFSCNIGDEKMSIMVDKSKNWGDDQKSLIMCYGDGRQVETMEDLYRLEGIFTFDIKVDDISIGKVEFPFSVAEALEKYKEKTQAIPRSVFTSGDVTVDAIAVDDAYQDAYSNVLKMVYVFYTVEASDTNLKADSTDVVMTINNKNRYTSGLYFDAGDYSFSYLNSHTEVDIYMGASQRFVVNFKVPEADLQSGRTITLSDSRIPGMEQLRISTDDIQHFNGASTLCNAITPFGFTFSYYARNYADDTTTNAVRSYMGNLGSGTIRDGKNQLAYAFSSDGAYAIRNSTVESTGIYIVTNYYVILVDSTTYKKVAELPYTIVNGQVGVTIPDINLERTT